MFMIIVHDNAAYNSESNISANVIEETFGRTCMVVMSACQV